MANVSSCHCEKIIFSIYRGVMPPAAWWGTWNHLAMTRALRARCRWHCDDTLWPWPSLRGVAKNCRSGFSESHYHAAVPSGAPLAHQTALYAWRITNLVSIRCCWWASWDAVRHGIWVVMFLSLGLRKYFWKNIWGDIFFLEQNQRLLLPLWKKHILHIWGGWWYEVLLGLRHTSKGRLTDVG